MEGVEIILLARPPGPLDRTEPRQPTNRPAKSYAPEPTNRSLITEDPSEERVIRFALLPYPTPLMTQPVVELSSPRPLSATPI